uniref:hypothetical protein n=1 Tax=Nocardia suismassiliense TaxID=2077092 RepID=UPI003F496F0E
MTDTDKVAQFKQQLGDLVDQAKTAGAKTQDRLAGEAHIAAPTVSRAIMPSYPLPTKETTRALVSACLRFIHADPMVVAELEIELNRWEQLRQEAVSQAELHAPPDPAHQREMTAIVEKTNDVRRAVMSALINYLGLSQRLRALEDTFEEQILNTAGELYLLKNQRKRLEAAFERIQAKVDKGEYVNAGELEEEVAAVLESCDSEFDPELDGTPDAEAVAQIPKPEHEDEVLDEATKERIYRTFRRIVLPRVHSDTSDADLSEFEVAFAAYRSRDYTLMEAFVIRYQDDIGAEQDGNVLTLAQLTTRLQEYQDAQKRLDNRMLGLQRTAATAELKAPQQARERMEKQGHRLRQEILAESERIRELETRLESLAETLPAQAGGNDG